MQVSVEAKDGLMREIRVELPAEEIEQEVERRLREVARSARLPGFRPGKIPFKVIQRRFAAAVRGEVFDERVKHSLVAAVADAELRIVGAPQIEPDVDVEAQRYGYLARFEVLPEIEPVALTGHQVKRPVAEVTDADVDEVIERLRRQRQTWETVERPAAVGDRVCGEQQLRLDGTLLEQHHQPDVALTLGDDDLLPGLTDGLTGIVAGETRALDIDLPETPPHPDSGIDPELAGRQVCFEVRCERVEAARLPDLDEAFFAGFASKGNDLDTFRAEVRENMERELAQRIRGKLREQVLEALLEANPLDLPEALIQQEIAALREQLGVPSAPSSMQAELPDDLFRESARRRVTLALLVAESVKRHNLKADEEQVRARLQTLAAAYDDPQLVIDHYLKDRERLRQIETMVVEDQLIDVLLTEMEVEDEATSFSALTAANHPGA